MFTMPIAKLNWCKTKPHSINVLYFYMYEISLQPCTLQPCTLHLLAL